MGEANSSITRVWPVFDHLFQLDSSGQSWLKGLLSLCASQSPHASTMASNPGSLINILAKFERPIPGNIAKVLGPKRAVRIGKLRNCFEKDFPPPARFLRWLIMNVDETVWPVDGKHEDGSTTQSLRKKLVDRDSDTVKKALDALASKGPSGSSKEWWAFEGFTSVDCYLETEHLLILIEGKRTEPVSSRTTWCPQRNQVVRNLEVAAEVGQQCGKDFAVILCSEQPHMLDEQDFVKSLPHLQSERTALRRHYLGCLTWDQIRRALCPDCQLPETVDDAVEFCSRFRQRDQS